MHLTYRLRMEYFYQIHVCHKSKFRLFINQSNTDLCSKFVEIHRNEKTLNKFVLVIDSIKQNIANKTQYNFELEIPKIGSVYAIKVDQHRFYTLQKNSMGYRELYICRYGKKESQENSKKLTATIDSIKQIQIKKMLNNE